MNVFMRQSHRWLSIVFVLLVLINTGFLFAGRQSYALGIATLVPLFLMMISGLWMFFQPYLRRRG